MSEDVELFEGTHTGYHHLPGGITHRRRIVFLRPDVWVIGDLAEGQGIHRISVTFQFAPGQATVEPGTGSVCFLCNGEPVAMALPLRPADQAAEIEEGWVSYQYGTRIPAPRLVFRVTARLPVHVLTVLAAPGPTPRELADRALAAWELAQARWPSAPTEAPARPGSPGSVSAKVRTVNDGLAVTA